MPPPARLIATTSLERHAAHSLDLWKDLETNSVSVAASMLSLSVSASWCHARRKSWNGVFPVVGLQGLQPLYSRRRDVHRKHLIMAVLFLLLSSTCSRVILGTTNGRGLVAWFLRPQWHICVRIYIYIICVCVCIYTNIYKHECMTMTSVTVIFCQS